MKIILKRLSMDMIENCAEVQAWLNQFTGERRASATSLLLNLQFVTWNTYSEWLRATLYDITENHCAVYAVSKFDNYVRCLWDESGNTIKRPSTSLGSEDLVNSVLANLKKVDTNRFLDHPSLEELKNAKIRDLILVDDSIGSGQRVSSFIELMMASKTFMSWWSFGWIRLYIVAFARTHESESRVVHLTAGSDHHSRKYQKSTKVNFLGHFAYRKGDVSRRWGANYQNILDLCDSTTSIPSIFRRGYGNAMTNIVFYHSVPDNLPGILWFQSADWNALFPDRSTPTWLPNLLDGAVQSRHHGKLPKDLISILRLIKRGIRNERGLARAMDLDIAVVQYALSRGRNGGFLTDNNRLTRTGLQTIWADKQGSLIELFDRSLYIPKRWSVDQGTVQPFGPRGETRGAQTDSTDGSPFVDGEAG